MHLMEVKVMSVCHAFAADLPDDGAVLVRAQFLLLCSMLFVYLASNLAI